MKYLNWLKIQKCYPYPLIFESVKKIMGFCKKKIKNEKNYKSYRPEKWIDYAHYHSPQSIRFVVVIWYHKYFFQFFFFFFFTINFYPFLHFWPSLPCTSQWGKFSSSKFCISDFIIEIYTKFQSGKHIIFYILANFFLNFFFTPNVRETLVRSWTLSYVC